MVLFLISPCVKTLLSSSFNSSPGTIQRNGNARSMRSIGNVIDSTNFLAFLSRAAPSKRSAAPANQVRSTGLDMDAQAVRAAPLLC
jgi:hypothetical protein